MGYDVTITITGPDGGELVPDGNLMADQQQYSGAAAPRLVIDAWEV